MAFTKDSNKFAAENTMLHEFYALLKDAEPGYSFSIECESYSRALSLRHRLSHARKLLGHNEYYIFMFQVEKGANVLRITRKRTMYRAVGSDGQVLNLNFTPQETKEEFERREKLERDVGFRREERFEDGETLAEKMARQNLPPEAAGGSLVEGVIRND